MGHLIEINDTLKLKKGAGFPESLEEGRVYDFELKDRRIFNLKPTRVFLVEEIDGKWNYRGHAFIIRMTIDAEKNATSGQFQVIQVYSPEYTQELNKHEPPVGKGYGV